MGGSLQQGPASAEIALGSLGPINYTDTVVNASRALSHIILTKPREVQELSLPSFRGEETEAQRDLTSPRLHSQEVVEPEFESRSVDLQGMCSLFSQTMGRGKERILWEALDKVGN